MLFNYEKKLPLDSGIDAADEEAGRARFWTQ